MPIAEREKNHTQGVLIMIDVAHNPTALGHNSREKMCPLKTHQNAETMPVKKPHKELQKKTRLEMQIKYEIFNILLAQHNKFQYNGKGTRHTERGK